MTLLHETGGAILGMPLELQSFTDLLVKLIINTVSALILIKKIYQPTKKGSEFLFSYMVFSPVIFFICHLFGKTELSMGFGFGLFAVFSILRYRTTSIPVKEMTYMFVIIGLSVINAIGFAASSIYELVFINVFLVGVVAILEKGFASGITSQMIMYEKVENLTAENEEELIKDLEDRTGKEILRYEVIESDFLRDSAKIRIYYKRIH